MTEEATQVSAPAEAAPVQEESVNIASEGVTEAQPQAEQAEEVASDNTEFLSTLGEDYKTVAATKGFNSADDIMKSYTNLESMMGKKFDELTNEELKSVYTKLGAPESKEDYGFEKAELPDGAEDVMTDWFASQAHEAGLTKDAASKLRESFMGLQAEEVKQAEIAIQVQEKDNIEKLKVEFGSAFDERINLAKTALNEVGGEEARMAILNAGLGSNPAIIKMLSEIGKMTSEGKMVDSGRVEAQFGITPEEAASKIAEKFADPAFLERYRNTMHQGHNEAVQELDKLYRLKNSA